VNDIHLIQYDDGEVRISTVLCAEHRPAQIAYLRRWQIGCVGMPAPEGAQCDNCETGAPSPLAP